jgi:hypothetical protein
LALSWICRENAVNGCCCSAMCDIAEETSVRHPGDFVFTVFLAKYMDLKKKKFSGGGLLMHFSDWHKILQRSTKFFPQININWFWGVHLASDYMVICAG